MFDETIVYNITLGERFSEEDILEVVKLSELDEVIDEKGLNYRVGENGKNLSVGELQRIEIARALIRNRPIILADEITSSLDNDKSSAIRNKILKSNITLIEVAHNIEDNEKLLYNKVWNLQDINKVY